MSKLVIATLLALGFGLAWAVGGVWIWDLNTRVARENTFGDQFFFPDYLAIEDDGTPLIRRLSAREGMEEYRDLEGHLIELSDQTKWLLPGRLRAAAEKPSWFAHEFRPDLWPEPPGDRRMRAFLDFRQAPSSPHVWWLMTDQSPRGSAYLVGYDRITNARVGFLGVQGFRENEPPADERFHLPQGDEALLANVRALQHSYPGPYYPLQSIKPAMAANEIPPWFVYLLTADGKIYQIDLGKRKVQSLPEKAPVQSIDLIYRGGVHVLLARTREEIIRFDVQGEVVDRGPIPRELLGQTFNWGETSTGESVAFTSTESDPGTMALHIHYYWIDRRGTVTRQTEFTLRGFDPLYHSAARLLPGALVPAPSGSVGFVGVYQPLMLLDTGQASGADAWLRALGEFWPSVLLTLLVSGMLSGMCYCRQSRYRASRGERIFWPLFVFVLGLPGWIGYRFGRSWPVLEKCSTCGAAVPGDRPSCAACHADFPLPALKGTEVFA
jgi:hypothetical protein